VGSALMLRSLLARRSPRRPFAYVTNLRGSSVSVVDTATGSTSNTSPSATAYGGTFAILARPA
jgi:DNA-binding beta-propeller fold protein YncE